MAICSTLGFEELELSMKEVSELPDWMVSNICEAGAIVAEAALTESARSVAPVDTGQLWRSIKRKRKLGRDGRPFFYVAPTGKRKTGSKTFLKDQTNAAVGYILEYGAPLRGIPSFQWMATAIEKCADQVLDAEFKVYDEYLNGEDF